jgi:hypothetical protein
MPSRQDESRPNNTNRIILLDDDEVSYWTRKWGLSEEELVEAVRAVGARSAAVARHLGRSEYD